MCKVKNICERPAPVNKDVSPTVPPWPGPVTNSLHKGSSNDGSPQKGYSCVSTATRDLWDRLFDEGYKADVSVNTDDGGIIYAHANILGMASPVIKAQLKQSHRFRRQRSISIRGVPVDAVRVFIRFLYSSCYEMKEMEAFVVHLLVLAHVYVVPHLKQECEKKLEHGLLTIDNVVDIFQLALLCDAPRLSLICHRMILKNFKTVCTTRAEQADGLDRLEKALLKEILEEEVLPRGSTRVQKRLSRTKVLIVLDDVSDSMQMKRLAGNRLRYGTGSRIIITSRDSRTLEQIVEDDKIYEVQGLKGDDALQLFCSRAFKNNSARRTDYKELAEKAVDYARSVPLALIVLGSLFFNCKRKQDWENEFNKLEQFPSESIQGVLRLSYDGLERHEKEIFLDLACFHQGRHVDMVKRMLDVRGFFARAGIRFLIDMSLISTDSKQGRETIEIHGLLEEMGRTIVRDQCIEDLGKRNRLFTDEDVYHVLKYKRETSIVQAIRVNWSKIEEQPLKHANFKKMSNLIMLIVDHSGIFDYKFTDSLDLPNSLHYLYWSEYPLESLPSKFSPENLVELHMPYSQVQKLWKEDQILVNLQVIDLRDSIHLTEVPNLSQSLKIVEIYLWGCKSLVEIPWYFQHLDKLTHLNLGGCSSLKYLPEMPGNIQYLDLQESGIKELPESVWSNENISYLSISRCKDLEKLPSNRCKLKVSGSFDLDQCTSLGEFFELPMDISSLTLYGCERLVSLPTNICKLKYLEELDLFRCSKLENFPEILEPMEHLESLNLSGTAVQELHSPFEFLPALKRIQLHGCKWLSSIPRSICKLKYLEELDLSWCSRLENFPEILEPMEHLESLNLSGTAIRQLHSSIEFLTALKEFNLSGCQQLEVFPTSIYRLANLKRLCLYGCWALQKLPLTYTGFLSLEELDLRDSGILEIPDGLVCSTSLKSIYLSRTRIRSIPASIKRASRLSKLNLVGCTQLQSLPELPVLCNVEAEGCTALKKMASSWTALTCLPKK